MWVIYMCVHIKSLKNECNIVIVHILPIQLAVCKCWCCCTKFIEKNHNVQPLKVPEIYMSHHYPNNMCPAVIHGCPRNSILTVNVD